MAINKVVYGDDTLIDLTQDSVSAENLLEGETAHDRSGVPVTGTAKQGHILKNQAGTAMTQQPNMQFADAHLTNDATNSATEIETFKALTSQEYAQATEDGAYIITDGDGAVIGAVSDDYVEVTADGIKNIRTLLNELYALVDWSKVGNDSYIKQGTRYYKYQREYESKKVFSLLFANTSHNIIQFYALYSSNSSFLEYDKDNLSDVSTTNVPSNGTKITLYYGNKKAVVDLQTTANRCLYDSNTTVKQKIDAKADKNDLIIATVNSENKIATFPVDTTALYYVEIGVSSQNTSTAIIAISKLYSNICPYVLAEKYASDCQISSISMSGNNVVLTMSTQYFYNVYAKQITKLE